MSMFGQSHSSAQHASQHTNAEQYNEYKRGHDHIAKNMADLLQAGNPIDNPDVQVWIGKHYEFVCQF